MSYWSAAIQRTDIARSLGHVHQRRRGLHHRLPDQVFAHRSADDGRWCVRDAVEEFILSAITGHTLITFSGMDVNALGISKEKLLEHASEHIVLQDYFQRFDGRPYGLGPLVYYFGYLRKSGQPVIISRDCFVDAVHQLKLYQDHYVPVGLFHPEGTVLNKRGVRPKV